MGIFGLVKLLLRGAVAWLELQNKKLPYEIVDKQEQRVIKLQQELENLRSTPSGHNAEHADRVRKRIVHAKRRLESLSATYLETPERRSN